MHLLNCYFYLTIKSCKNIYAYFILNAIIMTVFNNTLMIFFFLLFYFTREKKIMRIKI